MPILPAPTTPMPSRSAMIASQSAQYAHRLRAILVLQITLQTARVVTLAHPIDLVEPHCDPAFKAWRYGYEEPSDRFVRPRIRLVPDHRSGRIAAVNTGIHGTAEVADGYESFGPVCPLVVVTKGPVQAKYVIANIVCCYSWYADEAICGPEPAVAHLRIEAAQELWQPPTERGLRRNSGAFGGNCRHFRRNQVRFVCCAALAYPLL